VLTTLEAQSRGPRGIGDHTMVPRPSTLEQLVGSGVLLGLLFVVLACPVREARAQGGDANQTPITIVAPIEATSCTATPPTITVLGQLIDVSSAVIVGPDDTDGCTALTVGDTALVQLAGSSGPLVATAIGKPMCPF